MSGPLSAPTKSIESLVAQARVQRARGEWQTALQELPPLRKFPPPEKPRHDGQQSQATKRAATDGSRARQNAAVPSYLQPETAQPALLGQRLDRFV